MTRQVIVKEPLTKAVPSQGNQFPMVRHVVDKGDWTAKGFLGNRAPNPQQQTLCKQPWDRLNVSPDGPLCEECKAEYRRRHPDWPFPGGAS